MDTLIVEFHREEIFSFMPDDGGDEISIYAGRLRKWLLERCMDKVIDLTFPDEPLDGIIACHGLEAPRMQSMREDEASEPVIVGLWPSGTHVLIDGGHRRFFWAQRGVHVLRGWAVPELVWRTFEVRPGDFDVAIHYRDGSMLPQRNKGSG